MKRPTTLPADLTITMSHFADEQDAHQCADAVRGYLDAFGRFMELGRLERVYVSYDYAGTLASIDLGTVSDTVLKPTDDAIATGVAMAPSVLRGGEWKSLIVLNANYARSLSYELQGHEGITQEQLDALRAEMVHILAHECGHVHDHAMQHQNMPPSTYSQKWTRFEHRVKEPAMACWSEFIAEFLSAGFETKDSLRNYESTVCERLKGAWPAITSSIRQYRMHGGVDQVISEVGVHIRHILLSSAYMMGSLAHKDLTFEDGAPNAVQASKDHPELGLFLPRIWDELDRLRAQYPKFSGLDVFTPLSGVVHDLYKRVGLTFIENEAGDLRVEIPYRADTMPAPSEELEFRFSMLRSHDVG